MSDNKMILQALLEYEENNWESEDDEWQKQINKLISKYREENGNEQD